MSKKLSKDRTGTFSKRQTLDVKLRPAAKEEKLLVADPPEGYIAGWASTSDLDYSGHIVRAGAFRESIQQKGINGPTGIKLLVGHDRDKPAGVIKRLEYVNDDLWMEAQLETDISYVRDILLASRINNGLNFSVGFYLEEWAWQVNENTGDEWLEITKAELEEVSVVTVPANPRAVMTYVKGLEDEEEPFTKMSEFEKTLVELSNGGLSRNAAQRIGRRVKASPALFGIPTVATQPPKESPVLAKEKLESLHAAIGELRDLWK